MKKIMLVLLAAISLVGCSKEKYVGGKSVGSDYTAIVCTVSNSNSECVIIRLDEELKATYIETSRISTEPDTIWEFYNNSEEQFCNDCFEFGFTEDWKVKSNW